MQNTRAIHYVDNNMHTLTQPLQHHHKHCDDLFADAEAEARAGKWDACAQTFNRFRGEMESHFATEEQVLFPAFEATTGMTGGPTQVMRMEHSQVRELLGQMAEALAARNGGDFAGAAETLLILMQQHNMKEENILYPMCDRSLDAASINIGERLQERLSERLEGVCPA